MTSLQEQKKEAEDSRNSFIGSAVFCGFVTMLCGYAASADFRKPTQESAVKGLGVALGFIGFLGLIGCIVCSIKAAEQSKEAQRLDQEIKNPTTPVVSTTTTTTPTTMSPFTTTPTGVTTRPPSL